MQRAAAYGMPGVSVDGNDVVAVYEAAAGRSSRTRRRRADPHRGTPTATIPISSGYPDDRPEAERATWLARDPLIGYPPRLTRLPKAELAQIDEEVEARIGDAAVEAAPRPAPRGGRSRMCTDRLRAFRKREHAEPELRYRRAQ